MTKVGLGTTQVTICKVNGDLTRCHNAIRDTIFCMASQAAVSPHLEKPNILARYQAETG